MTANQINGIVRAVVPALLSYLVAKGWLTDSAVGEVVAAITTLVAAGWSVYTNAEKKS